MSAPTMAKQEVIRGQKTIATNKTPRNNQPDNMVDNMDNSHANHRNGKDGSSDDATDAIKDDKNHNSKERGETTKHIHKKASITR